MISNIIAIETTTVFFQSHHRICFIRNSLTCVIKWSIFWYVKTNTIYWISFLISLFPSCFYLIMLLPPHSLLVFLLIFSAELLQGDTQGGSHLACCSSEGTPKSSIYRWILHYEQSSLGYPDIRKPTCGMATYSC